MIALPQPERAEEPECLDEGFSEHQEESRDAAEPDTLDEIVFNEKVPEPGSLGNEIVELLGVEEELPLASEDNPVLKILDLPVDPESILPAAEDANSIALMRFVPKEFLRILNKESAADLRLGDHVKKDMTIFFSDIRAFTSLSEGLTPEENFKFINSYLARVVPVVNAYGGFVDKYIGDAIMALFPEDTGADSAVLAAIEMQKKIVEYNSHRANCGYRPLSMGIGLHTGTLMLGVVGVENRMQSTVISDAVNLASRLESITKVFNVSLAISEETFKNLEDPGAYKYRFIGKVRVKGKSDPVSVFEIFDGIDPVFFEKKMRANRFFEQGMLSYYQKDFTGAMFFFRKVLEVLPEDGASAFYLDNCIAKAGL
jgi:two-component system sensor histidine kinase ChiS